MYGQLLTQFNECVTTSGHLLQILQYVTNDLRTTSNVVDAEIDRALAELKDTADELERQVRSRRQAQQAGGAPSGQRRQRVVLQPCPPSSV